MKREMATADHEELHSDNHLLHSFPSRINYYDERASRDLQVLVRMGALVRKSVDVSWRCTNAKR